MGSFSITATQMIGCAMGLTFINAPPDCFASLVVFSRRSPAAASVNGNSLARYRLERRLCGLTFAIVQGVGQVRQRDFVSLPRDPQLGSRHCPTSPVRLPAN